MDRFRKMWFNIHEFQVTIEEEIFQKQGDKVLAMSTLEILNCNPDSPAAGWINGLESDQG